MKREFWIDATKLFACVLVAVGHMTMGLESANILESSMWSRWFIQTIYYFHVPLFFVCSGYLYQKRSVVRTFSAWGSNILRKLISLGIPYFVFSFANWVLKEIFASEVNTQNEALTDVLFLSPSSPFWYLYTLFFLFLIIPTFSKKREAAVGLTIALVLYILAKQWKFGIYAVDQTMLYSIWFVLGMACCVFNVPDKIGCIGGYVGGLTGSLFIGLSWIVSYNSFQLPYLSLLMGLLGCVSTISVAILVERGGRANRCLAALYPYTS